MTAVSLSSIVVLDTKPMLGTMSLQIHRYCSSVSVTNQLFSGGLSDLCPAQLATVLSEELATKIQAVLADQAVAFLACDATVKIAVRNEQTFAEM